MNETASARHSLHVKLRVCATFLALVTTAACSADEPAPLGPGTALIGPEGGTLELGEVRLQVPANALTTAQTLSITTRTNLAGLNLPGAVASDVYTFEPEGLRFERPAQVSFAAGRVDAHVVAWSRADDPTRLEALETEQEGTRLTASVTHFSVGAVVSRAASDPDAGIVDAEVIDSGGPVDVGFADAGFPDAEPEDTGPAPDAAADGGVVADAGPLDTGSVPDAGPISATVLPTMLPTADACQTVTASLSVSAGTAMSWRMLSNAELSQLAGSPQYSGASVDPSTGPLTLQPTASLSGYLRSTGVEVTLTTGQTVQRAWDFSAAGIGTYAVSQGGGPAIFTSPAPTIPAISQANPGAWSPVTVAMPIAQHPCAIRYVTNTFLCPGGETTAWFMDIDAQGVLQITDPSGLAQMSTGPYCLPMDAVWGTSGIILHSTYLTFQLVP